MNNKIFAVLIAAGTLCTCTTFSVKFDLVNELGRDIELKYQADTSRDFSDESQPEIIKLNNGASISFDNNAEFWRIGFKYDNIYYSIVRSKDDLKAGYMKNGRPHTPYGTLLGSQIDTSPNVIHEIVLVNDTTVDLNKKDTSGNDIRSRLSRITLER